MSNTNPILSAIYNDDVTTRIIDMDKPLSFEDIPNLIIETEDKELFYVKADLVKGENYYFNLARFNANRNAIREKILDVIKLSNDSKAHIHGWNGFINRILNSNGHLSDHSNRLIMGDGTESIVIERGIVRLVLCNEVPSYPGYETVFCNGVKYHAYISYSGSNRKIKRFVNRRISQFFENPFEDIAKFNYHHKLPDGTKVSLIGLHFFG